LTLKQGFDGLDRHVAGAQVRATRQKYQVQLFVAKPLHQGLDLLLFIGQKMAARFFDSPASEFRKQPAAGALFPLTRIATVRHHRRPKTLAGFFGEVRLVSTLFQQTKPTAHHAAVDGFEHIVNHRSRAGDGQGLHLNTDFADAGRFGFDTQLVFLRLRRHHDFIQGQGWQKGIPSGVRSAACTAATRAVGNPSGLGSSSAKRRGMDSRSSLIKTSALA
jgi:hypothetical protein